MLSSPLLQNDTPLPLPKTNPLPVETRAPGAGGPLTWDSHGSPKGRESTCHECCCEETWDAEADDMVLAERASSPSMLTSSASAVFDITYCDFRVVGVVDVLENDGSDPDCGCVVASIEELVSSSNTTVGNHKEVDYTVYESVLATEINERNYDGC